MAAKVALIVLMQVTSCVVVFCRVGIFSFRADSIYVAMALKSALVCIDWWPKVLSVCSKRLEGIGKHFRVIQAGEGVLFQAVWPPEWWC